MQLAKVKCSAEHDVVRMYGHRTHNRHKTNRRMRPEIPLRLKYTEQIFHPACAMEGKSLLSGLIVCSDKSDFPPINRIQIFANVIHINFTVELSNELVNGCVASLSSYTVRTQRMASWHRKEIVISHSSYHFMRSNAVYYYLTAKRCRMASERASARVRVRVYCLWNLCCCSSTEANRLCVQ